MPRRDLMAGGDRIHADWVKASFAAAEVRGCMTTRAGGRSVAPFDTMNLRHGVDTREAVDANRALFATALGARPVYLDQVHGTRVVRVGAADARAGAPVHTADASVTAEPGIACTVLTADCLPALFAARNGRGVGAAHAGWRGLAAGVLEATLDEVAVLADCTAGEIDVWLGACIGPQHFEVGADVLDAFGASVAVAVAVAIPSPSPPPAIEPIRFVPLREGKWLANLQVLALDRLHAAGVVRIEGNGDCTVADPSRFFSFRRDRVTGRMAAAVWIEGDAGR